MGFGHGRAGEDQPQYTIGIDPDPDTDPDTDGNREPNNWLQTRGWHWQLVASVAQQQEDMDMVVDAHPTRLWMAPLWIMD
jgi:hypothetical protein